MLYALNKKGERILSEPKMHATCPLCKKNIISKCGEINIWHWAHESIEECDTWSEGETEWHLNWKSLVNSKYTECKIKNHRADIFSGFNIIKLQNSSISPEEIRKRELFYGRNMMWIFNCTEPYQNNRLILNEKENGKYHGFRLKWPRKYLLYIQRRMYFDLGNEFLLHVKKIYYDEIFTGWGYLLSKGEFKKLYLKMVLKK